MPSLIKLLKQLISIRNLTEKGKIYVCIQYERVCVCILDNYYDDY